MTRSLGTIGIGKISIVCIAILIFSVTFSLFSNQAYGLEGVLMSTHQEYKKEMKRLNLVRSTGPVQECGVIHKVTIDGVSVTIAEVEGEIKGKYRSGWQTCWKEFIDFWETKYWTEERTREVWGELIWLWGFGDDEAIDHLHRDKFGPWTVVPGSERTVAEDPVVLKRDFETKSVDPPPPSISSNYLFLNSGTFTPDFRFIDGTNITLEFGGSQNEATITSHVVFLDGNQINEVTPMEIGVTPLSPGKHILLVKVFTDFFQEPVDFEITLEVSTVYAEFDSQLNTVKHDSVILLNATLTNGNDLDKNLDISVSSTQPGWTVGLSSNTIFVPAHHSIPIAIPIHAFATDFNSQITKILLTTSDGSNSYTTSTDLISIFPYEKLVEFEGDVINLLTENDKTIKDLQTEIDRLTSGGPPISSIPDWVRNNAGWWAQGLISDDDFTNGIQWLIQNGIITTN